MMNRKKCIKYKKIKSLNEFHNQKNHSDGKTSKCKICNKKYSEKYHKINREKLIKKMNEDYKKNKKERIKKQIEYYNKRNNTDIHFKLRNNLRTRIYHVLKGTSKSKSTMKLIGCSISVFKNHIEKQFKENMSWNNYGKWHLDHIKPCALFNLANKQDQEKCFHYMNYQPLWAEENIKKRDKYEVK